MWLAKTKMISMRHLWNQCYHTVQGISSNYRQRHLHRLVQLSSHKALMLLSCFNKKTVFIVRKFLIFLLFYYQKLSPMETITFLWQYSALKIETKGAYYFDLYKENHILFAHNTGVLNKIYLSELNRARLLHYYSFINSWEIVFLRVCSSCFV